MFVATVALSHSERPDDSITGKQLDDLEAEQCWLCRGQAGRCDRPEGSLTHQGLNLTCEKEEVMSSLPGDVTPLVISVCSLCALEAPSAHLAHILRTRLV